MCSQNNDLLTLFGVLGFSVIEKAMEVDLSANSANTSTDVLGTATQAYQQGKITKNQFMAVINALDETPVTVETRAYAQHPNNREYLDAVKYLNQFR